MTARRSLEDALAHELDAREHGTLDVVDEHGVVIGTATWRGELPPHGRWDCKDEHFGIRAWAPTFVRATSTVRRLVEKKGAPHGHRIA